jgi:homogentisate phytyltransferase/homogentisate geranylgeranyltransferase
MIKALNVFWKFSRPHTIIGSICSISSLYVLASKSHSLYSHLGLFATTLVAALACNVFIVGINQIEDVELDKINKPYLPLAAGSLMMATAKRIVWVCLLISLVVSLISSWLLFVLILVILLIGMAYSLPPLKLKQHHLPAALAITIVRGLLVNVGIFLHFQYSIDHEWQLPDYIVCLTIFMMAFSIAIAWFKDLPDTDGDQQYRIKTLAILYSKKMPCMEAWHYLVSRMPTCYTGP